MKLAEFALLTDENIDREVVAYLRARGFDVQFVVSDGRSATDRTARIDVPNRNGPVRIEPLERLVMLEGIAVAIRIPAADPDHPAPARPLYLIGRTAVGRATCMALKMNSPRLVSIRLLFAKVGLHPPRR